MTEEHVVQILIDGFGALFPRRCSCCGIVFEGLEDYVRLTKPLRGAMLADWLNGVAVLANCECGTTLSLSTADLPLAIRVSLNDWARQEAARRMVPFEHVIHHLRLAVRRTVEGER